MTLEEFYKAKEEGKILIIDDEEDVREIANKIPKNISPTVSITESQIIMKKYTKMIIVDKLSNGNTLITQVSVEDRKQDVDYFENTEDLLKYLKYLVL